MFTKQLTMLMLVCLTVMMGLPASAADVTAKWDFKNNIPDGIKSTNIQGTTAEIASNVDGIKMSVIATNGKLYSVDRDNAQFNPGTILRIPVTTTKDTVTVVSYPDCHNYNVGGIAATADETNHRATSSEVAQGYVEIVGTGNSYLYSIRVVHVDMIQEKALYSTDFTDWTALPISTDTAAVAKSTKYSHENLIFKIFDSEVNPTGTNTSKFNNLVGWLMAAKKADPCVITSPLANITKVHFLHAATGDSRGWKLDVKGDGDADWVTVSSSYATTASGTDVTVGVNRTNCQLRFTNLTTNQNAYMFQLDIYGKLDMSKVPALGSFEVNSKSYDAADVFEEQKDGSMLGTVEISKSETAISSENRITNVTASNGDLGEISYNVVNSDTTIVSIPVSMNGATVNYKLIVAYKPLYTITYYNADGITKLGSQTVEKDATIKAFAKNATDVAVAEGSKFRGWVYGLNIGKKATTSDVITSDLNLYALVTEIETASTTKRYAYDLKNQYWYDEDHENINITNGSWHDNTHGWALQNGSTIKVVVGGNAYIVLGLCRYGNAGNIKLTNSKGDSISAASYPVATDGATTTLEYTGAADTLTLTVKGNSPYLHSLTIMNVQKAPIKKNDAGWYVVNAGDADNLLNTIDIANGNTSSLARTFIYIPNGTYDLGETVLTTISQSNISLIGQDSGKVVIVNAPDISVEGIGTTETLVNLGSDNYFQNITLKNALDYYRSKSAGRAVCLWDKGTHTICQNVNMLSYQDTYYSNNSKGEFYFEGGEIHGTVDFLCGEGAAYYNKVNLVVEKRNADGSGGCTITAPSTVKGQHGYIFDNCTITNYAANYNLGRTWQNDPECVWLNTKVADGLVNSRWTLAGMGIAADRFFEYNPSDGCAENTVTFTKGTVTNAYNTILSKESASSYAIDKVFTDWAPATIALLNTATDVSISNGSYTLPVVDGTAGYAIFKGGKFVTIISGHTYTPEDATATDYTYAIANSMGAFGAQAKLTKAAVTGISAIDNETISNTVYYSVDGKYVKAPRHGVYIKVSKSSDGNLKTEKVIVK